MEKDKASTPAPLSPNNINKYIPVRNNLPTPTPIPSNTPTPSPTCFGMFDNIT
jgi:hypothetical protein